MKFNTQTKTIVILLIIIFEIFLYLMFRNEIKIFLKSSFPEDLSGVEENLISSLIIGMFAIINGSILLYFTKLGYKLFLFPSTSRIRSALNKNRKWLLATDIHWASTKYGKQRKIANCVEGLFAIIYSFDTITKSEKIIANDVIKFIVNNINKDGLKSLSINKSAVHCTAMGLFILLKMKKQKLFKFDRELITQINLLVNSLINSKTDKGWGFINKPVENDNEIRFFSTFWALRALNATTYCDTEDFSNLLQHNIIRFVPNQLFGFGYKDAPKVCNVSLFLILVFELNNEKTKQEILRNIDIKNLIAFLLSQLKKHRFIEVEEYSYNINKIEKLSWVHISVGLGIHALSLAKKYLTNIQIMKLNSIVKFLIKNHLHADGYFWDNSLNFNKNDPLIYPTAYFLSGLYYYLKEIHGVSKIERILR